MTVTITTEPIILSLVHKHIIIILINHQHCNQAIQMYIPNIAQVTEYHQHTCTCSWVKFSRF